MDTSVSKLDQVSTVRSQALLDLGIKNLNDLLNYFPIDYIDLSNISSIADSKIGFAYTIVGKVHEVKVKEPKPKIKLVEITITDDTSTLIVTTFNQLWLADALKQNDQIVVSGNIEFLYGFKRMTNPYIHQLNNNQNVKDFAKLIPVYKHTDKLSSNRILNIVKAAFDYLEHFESFLPTELSKQYKLMDYFEALKTVHFPNSLEQLKFAKRTVKFAQVFAQQTFVLKQNPQSFRQKNNMLHFEYPQDKLNNICQTISLYKDMGAQSLFYCKDNELFLQYKNHLKDSFEKFKVNVGYVNCDTSKELTWKYLYDFKNGDLDALLCTDAIDEQNICSKNLSLIIVDEKQNFYPQQLNKIFELSKDADVLYTTCMPLNDNLANLLYPDSDKEWTATKNISNCNIDIIDKDLFMSAYQNAVEFAKAKNQVLVYVPDVDFIVKRASEEIFNGWDVELITKNSSNKDLQNALDKFSQGKLDVLVFSYYKYCNFNSCKPVYVVVEDANKIGLTRLHQTRNSVSQNGFENKMALVCSFKGNAAKLRLEQLKEIAEGKSLVDKDLSKLKTGTNIGFKKWGFGFLKLIDFSKDDAIIKTAIEDAKKYYKEQNKYLDFYINNFKD